jgi:hypothetical protein
VYERERVARRSEKDAPPRARQPLAPSAECLVRELQGRAGNQAVVSLLQRAPTPDSAAPGEVNFHDPDYPGLKLTSLGRNVEYGLDVYRTSTGETLYWLEGKYYSDLAARQLVNVAALVGASAAQDGDGTTYRYPNGSLTGDLISIPDFARRVHNHRQELNTPRYRDVFAQMQHAVPVHPIVVTRVATPDRIVQGQPMPESLSIVDGNHRFWAAHELGYRNVPVNYQ